MPPFRRPLWLCGTVSSTVWGAYLPQHARHGKPQRAFGANLSLTIETSTWELLLYFVPSQFVARLSGIRGFAGARNPGAVFAGVVFALGCATLQASAQTKSVQALPNGMRVQNAGQVLELTALRDDVPPCACLDGGPGA